MKKQKSYTRKRLIDEFTDLPISRQQKWQLRRAKEGRCVICGEPKVTAWHCLKHAVANREWARKYSGSVRRNDTLTYRLVDTTLPKKEPVSEKFALDDLKRFPLDFAESGDAMEVKLPDEVLKLALHPYGHYLVTSGRGFDHRVHNEIEGKFLVYAHERGERSVKVPKNMFQVFKAVKAYEKYCYELRQEIVRKLERNLGSPQQADEHSKRVLQSHGLPMV